MENKKEIITCVDCGQEFELTEGWHKEMLSLQAKKEKRKGNGPGRGEVVGASP